MIWRLRLALMCRFGFHGPWESLREGGTGQWFEMCQTCGTATTPKTPPAPKD